MDLSKIKVVVFDVGGTLMEFADMPLDWTGYYKNAFNALNDKLNLKLTEFDINKSVAILYDFNPRHSHREIEIPPVKIFMKCTEHWNLNLDIDSLISSFFDFFYLTIKIFSYSIPTICKLKESGKVVGLFTDLPNGMPDDYFKKYISDIVSNCDFYISSQICGYRKPNPYALELIANRYAVDRAEMLYIGDEPKDEILTKRFGCHFASINDFINA